MGHNKWNQTYNTATYVYGTEPNDFLRANFHLLPKGKILLLAEGEGRNAVFLAEQGYQVTAVDISDVGLAKARRLAEEKGVEIETVCADLATFDLGEQQWDGVVSVYCHLPSSIRHDLYQRLKQAMKPTSVLILEGYTPAQLAYKSGGPRDVDMLTSKQDLQLELPFLAFSQLDELEREVIEGVKHQGLAAVVQAIGKPQL